MTLLDAKMMTTPNLSMRMTELTAACARPLIANLPSRVVEYNRVYDMLVNQLETLAGPELIVVPKPLPEVSDVGDHFNFHLGHTTPEQNKRFRATCSALGVPIGWMRSDVNARWHVNWRKYGTPTFELPNIDALLASGYDLKLPPHFSDEDVLHVANVLAYAATDAVRADQSADGFAA